MGSKKAKKEKPQKYYATMEQVICMAPIDSILEIQINDETAWDSPVSATKVIKIDEPNLFGGDDAEGGVSGDVEVRLGKPDQEKSPYLAKISKELLSATRGVVSVVSRDFYLGLSPYLKAWSFRVKSTNYLNTTYDVNWYPEKATIDHDRKNSLTGQRLTLLNTTPSKKFRVFFDPSVPDCVLGFELGLNEDTVSIFYQTQIAINKYQTSNMSNVGNFGYAKTSSKTPIEIAKVFSNNRYTDGTGIKIL